MISLDDYNILMAEKGWVVFEDIVPKDLVESMRKDLYHSYDHCRVLQMKNGIPENNEFTVHHLVGQQSSYIDYLEWSEKLHPYIESYFSGLYTLNSFGGAINRANSRSYAHEIHKDVRTYSSEIPLILNTLVMLDDFTEENGSTYLMSGSHKSPHKPGKEEFYEGAERALGKSGSVLIFNSNVWHAGGDNTTDKDRCSVTPMYCQPYVKQQFDYPRALGYDNISEFSHFLRQIIGYNARIPATLDEWYQPPEKRMYQPGQG